MIWYNATSKRADEKHLKDMHQALCREEETKLRILAPKHQ